MNTKSGILTPGSRLRILRLRVRVQLEQDYHLFQPNRRYAVQSLPESPLLFPDMTEMLLNKK